MAADDVIWRSSFVPSCYQNHNFNFGAVLYAHETKAAAIVAVPLHRESRKGRYKLRFLNGCACLLFQNRIARMFSAGPSGKVMLIPEEDPNATHIMIATGTGIAPFRAYLRRFFMEDVPSFKFGGLAWLFLGVANTDSLLYHDEFSKYKEEFPDNFRSAGSNIILAR